MSAESMLVGLLTHGRMIYVTRSLGEGDDRRAYWHLYIGSGCCLTEVEVVGYVDVKHPHEFIITTVAGTLSVARGNRADLSHWTEPDDTQVAFSRHDLNNFDFLVKDGEVEVRHQTAA